MPTLYHIWSTKHQGFRKPVVIRTPGHSGYTRDITEAWQWTKSEAERLAEKANRNIKRGETLDYLIFPTQVFKKI